LNIPRDKLPVYKFVPVPVEQSDQASD
jgi:hypothetical protein